MIEYDWLFPHHPIPNAKFPPITVLLNRSTYLIIKVPRSPLHPVPKSHGHPKSMNKLTLNEPAKIVVSLHSSLIWDMDVF